MTTGDLFVIAILLLVVLAIIMNMVEKKKNGKGAGCSGCPNYGSCRAHVGCNNNPNNRKSGEQ